MSAAERAVSKVGGARERIDLTERQLRIIEREVAEGAYQDTAALLAGVKPKTLEKWLGEGRRDPEGRHGALARRVDLAHAKYEARGNKKIKRSRDVRATMWDLERRNPRRYHLAIKVHLERTEAETLAAVEGAAAEVIQDADLRARFLDAVARRLGAGAEGAALAAAGEGGDAEG